MGLINCIIYCALMLVAAAKILYEGSPCTNYNQPGICTKQPNCPLAVELVSKSQTHNLTRCGFTGKTEIVCCPLSASERSLQNETVTNKRKSVTACEKFSKFPTPIFPHIFGGRSAEPGQVPFIVALALYFEENKFYKFSCAGTIISERFVLTAAHCVSTADQTTVDFIRAGVVDVPETVTELNEATDYKVKNISGHPKYSRKVNDIALLELENSFVFRSDLRPACLFPDDHYPTKMMIAGWGITSQNAIKSTSLMLAEANHFSLKDCIEKFKKKQNVSITSNQLCTLHDQSNTCEGDSGGPLFLSQSNSPYIVGILSYGEPGCDAGTLSVYASVPKYLEWIESVVWPS